MSLVSTSSVSSSARRALGELGGSIGIPESRGKSSTDVLERGSLRHDNAATRNGNLLHSLNMNGAVEKLTRGVPADLYCNMRPLGVYGAAASHAYR